MLVLPPDVDVVVEWPDGMGLLGVGTTYRPPAPQEGLDYASGIGSDGLWRWAEFLRNPQLLDHTAPYMAWAHIPTPEQLASSILYRRAKRADCAAGPELPVKGRKKRGMGTMNGMYRLRDELYEDLKRRQDALRRQCELATRLIKRATRKFDVHSKSVIRTVLADVREPVREYLDSARALWTLRHGGLAVFQEYDLCFTALQRTLGVMLAYFDFACAILPPRIAPGLADLAKLTPGEHRRGVVLAGKDIRPYISFFRRLDIPVWVYISIAQIEGIPRDKLGPADLPRCDVSVCDQISKLFYKLLKFISY